MSTNNSRIDQETSRIYSFGHKWTYLCPYVPKYVQLTPRHKLARGKKMANVLRTRSRTRARCGFGRRQRRWPAAPPRGRRSRRIALHRAARGDDHRVPSRVARSRMPRNQILLVRKMRPRLLSSRSRRRAARSCASSASRCHAIPGAVPRCYETVALPCVTTPPWRGGTPTPSRDLCLGRLS